MLLSLGVHANVVPGKEYRGSELQKLKKKVAEREKRGII